MRRSSGWGRRWGRSAGGSPGRSSRELLTVARPSAAFAWVAPATTAESGSGARGGSRYRSFVSAKRSGRQFLRRERPAFARGRRRVATACQHGPSPERSLQPSRLLHEGPREGSREAAMTRTAKLTAMVVLALAFAPVASKASPFKDLRIDGTASRGVVHGTLDVYGFFQQDGQLWASGVFTGTINDVQVSTAARAPMNGGTNSTDVGMSSGPT